MPFTPSKARPYCRCNTPSNRNTCGSSFFSELNRCYSCSIFVTYGCFGSWVLLRFKSLMIRSTVISSRRSRRRNRFPLFSHLAWWLIQTSSRRPMGRPHMAWTAWVLQILLVLVHAEDGGAPLNAIEVFVQLFCVVFGVVRCLE